MYICMGEKRIGVGDARPFVVATQNVNKREQERGSANTNRDSGDFFSKILAGTTKALHQLNTRIQKAHSINSYPLKPSP